MQSLLTLLVTLATIAVIIVVTYLLSITIVVVGQEVNVFAGVALFIAVAYGAFKLFQMRLTRL